MKIFNNIICSRIDLRNIVQEQLERNHRSVGEILNEIKKKGNDFIRHFSPTNDRVFYINEKQMNCYEKVKCELNKQSVDYTSLSNALADFLDIEKLKCDVELPPYFDVTKTGTLLQGPMVGEAFESLCICRIDNGDEKDLNLSIMYNGKPWGDSHTMAIGRYVYAVEVKYRKELLEQKKRKGRFFSEILDNKLEKSGNLSISLGEINTKSFGSVLQIEDLDNSINSISINNVVSFTTVPEGKYLYIDNKGMLNLSTDMHNRDLIMEQLSCYGEVLLYVKSYKDTIITLSEKGVLRKWSKKENLTLPGVLWTKIDEINSRIEYRQFDSENIKYISL